MPLKQEQWLRESYANTSEPEERKDRKMKFNVAGGGVLHNPGGLWTMECHADSKNMNLSESASISPPTETVSRSVLGSHREAFIHPTGCAVNGSPNSAFSLSVSHSPSSSYSFIQLAREEVESPHPHLICASHHSQHRRALCNLLNSESHAVWTSMLSSTVYVHPNVWSACFELYIHTWLPLSPIAKPTKGNQWPSSSYVLSIEQIPSKHLLCLPISTITCFHIKSLTSHVCLSLLCSHFVPYHHIWAPVKLQRGSCLTPTLWRKQRRDLTASGGEGLFFTPLKAQLVQNAHHTRE